MVEIKGVTKGSPADRAGVTAGEVLLCVDGHDINDMFDYSYYTTPRTVTLTLSSRTITVKKQEYAPLGLAFEQDIFDSQRRCKNNCVFCFIDQMPSGMRDTLYVKDDDERLSFLFGNYITLTNLSEELLHRIETMRFSPINISVHTTNPELRSRMMGNRHAGRLLEYLNRFASLNITMNVQLVLCPGYNDGDELRRTLGDLQRLFPAVQSVSAVPVGLTKYRDGLAPLQPFDKAGAKKVIETVKEFGGKMLSRYGTRLFYISDEFYILANQPFPYRGHYEEFHQLENGVGMSRLFIDRHKRRRLKGGYDIATGTLAAPMIADIVANAECKTHVYAVKNDRFGHSITVSGLLTGRDVVAQLKGRLTADTLLLPRNMFRTEGDITLDDMTAGDIAKALGVKVEVVERLR